LAGAVETFAANLGWRIAKSNVLVEGTRDVAIIEHAAELYAAEHGVQLLTGELAVIAAGYGDQGGVGGINRRLITARVLAGSDPDEHGRLRHRFIGLYDNDRAGQGAIRAVSAADITVRPFSEVFLLRPVMSLKGGVDANALKTRFERDNAAFPQLDWEIEDLVSEDVLKAFEADFPTAVFRTRSAGGRTHRDFTDTGKGNLVDYVRDYATLADVTEVIKLIRALRDYTHLRIDHIVV